jgi:hypothetical protein
MFTDSLLDNTVVNNVPTFFGGNDCFVAFSTYDLDTRFIVNRPSNNLDIAFSTEFHGDFLFLMSYSTRKYKLSTTINAQNTLAKGLSVSKPFANPRKIAQI